MVVSKFGEAMTNVQRELTKIKSHFMWDVPEMILFFSDSQNFRKKIYPSYKGHRNRKKPCGYKRVITELAEGYEVIRMPTLEADDAMGIYATANILATSSSVLTRTCDRYQASCTTWMK